ncbi:phage resistance protein [Allochromatium palmeri]|uniref:Phage resistance protein n=1 Tax=Allochromatium palmeri TaxID=231048 RepID=A0A6N8EH38_9GAMM|nr:phage resistance protein [Allochromatium palmeri]MTW22209.1 phage resistance protein [Allochromatium palmeri]
MSVLIKDLIHIPERVQRGDFVLNLASGLEADAVEQTLKDYVVTPQLARCFEDALSFIQSTAASRQNRNKGAYLHGSFGSGKSHFMAVLHLLLQGNPQARAIPELAPSVAKHSDWMQSRNILLAPYHMIGAASIESGVLGGYARYIRKLHPDAPVPGFYMSERLFADAQAMRGHMGDERFFAALNSAGGAAGGDDGWGDAATGWEAVSFEAVVSGQAGDDDRIRLVGDLVGSLFKSFADLANTESGGYLEFDEGLRVMTRHAKALGYDAVILFLDELILWLASRLSDRNFINSEIQKVVKLVETGLPRELPLISFIARQRDLREFVGDQYSGVDQEILSDSLKYWEGRFHTITLEDRNLPVIAQRRLLAPVSAAAQDQIEAAFAQTERMREEAFTLLLTSQGDRDMFRALYPFSPALVQALVALSSALQRERTALKVMLMLLVEQRETLALGRVIPVGDLYDVIASEAEPFSEQMRQHFDNAKLLFERKLIPVLEQEHQISLQALQELAPDEAKRQAFNNDLRLLKTLVLAALVPEVESFKQLTATKLAALNHGTIRSPIPGREAQTVLQKCRKWAGQVGEIKISDDPNPTIGVQLSGVDTESIIEQARINDNDGNRRRLVREMVFDAFGIRDDNQLFVEHEWLWRGTRRRVEVLFQNILGITDDSLFESRDDQWKVIIDFPFGAGTHSPTDAQARVRNFEAAGGQAKTICWLPYFLSQSAQKNLGKLVVLEDILKSEDSFNRYSRHLSPQDRASARTLLDNQRSQLRQQLKDILIGAYGVAQALPGSLDHNDLLESPLLSLQPGFTPRPPQGTTMAKAFEQLLGQALAWQYPDHPAFFDAQGDGEVKTSDLGKVFTELRRAIHAPHGRIDVDGPLRPLMRQIAQPLKLGEMHERHFIFKEDWPQHLSRELARMGGEATVRALREAMDQPRPRGLPTAVQNLLILVFAEHGQYAFTFHGGPFEDVSLKDIRDDLVLIKQELAEPEIWRKALDHFAAVLGHTINPLLTANNQNALQKEVQAEVNARLEDCRSLVADLTQQLDALGLAATGNRLANARLAVQWLEDLQSREGPALVEALAELEPVTSLQALGRSLITATRVSHALADNNWDLLRAVWGEGEGTRIKRAVADALAADELVTSLADALKQAQADATRLIQRPPAVVPPIDPPPTPPVRPKGKRVLKQDDRQGLAVDEARRVLEEIEPLLSDGVTLDISYRILGETD